MRFVMVAACGLSLLLSGCGSGPRTAEVTGRITFDGKPQANVLIEFEPQQSVNGKVPAAARGVTDADGRYRAFRTGKNLVGVAVGPAVVRVSAVQDSAARVDPRYANGGLSLEVVPGANVYDLDLPATPGKDWSPGQASSAASKR